ncbi:MAG: hypothetical protein J6S76_01745 [Clostridia bacterium]|nr:hypothetical protein [Clostridia bacterium]
MTVKELAEALSLKILTNESQPELDREISGVYVGDLLSRAMSRVEADNLWITIMSNVNVIAVAALTDPACILLCEDVEADDDVRARACENGITLLGSPRSAYELCVEYHKQIDTFS